MPAATAYSPPAILQFVRDHDSRELDLESVLDRYLIARPCLTEGAAEQLRVAVNLTTEWLGHKLAASEIFEEEPLERFVSWLFKSPFRGRTRSPATVRGRRSSLLTLWDFAFRKRLWQVPPIDTRDLAPLDVPDEDPVAWSVAEWQRIMDSAAKAPSNGHWTPEHWQTLLDCLWRSAERVQGMMLCRLADLDVAVLCIRAEYTKDGKAGLLNLGPELADRLRNLARRESCPLIWDFPSDAATIKGKLATFRNRYRSDVLIPTGLPHDRHHLLHCVRRTSVTEVANVLDEKQAQEHARHTTPKMTKRYISRAKLRKKRTSDALPSLIGDPQKRLF